MKSGLVLSLAAPPRGRAAGEVIDDGTITTKIKSKLLVEKEISSLDISVATFEGAVTLTGAVDSAAQKSKAEQIQLSHPRFNNSLSSLEMLKKRQPPARP